jgi:hypothetical protein
MVEHPAVNGRVAGSSPAPGDDSYSISGGLMKKTVVYLSVMLSITPVWAKGNHPESGCGLGYLLLSHNNHSKVALILGATTNGTYGNQTFGISSGTSGCTEDGALNVVKATEAYTEANFDTLRREMALGQGEFVQTFATLLGATETNRPAMVALFQSHYSTLYPAISTTPDEMLNNLMGILSEHPALIS